MLHAHEQAVLHAQMHRVARANLERSAVAPCAEPPVANALDDEDRAFESDPNDTQNVKEK